MKINRLLGIVTYLLNRDLVTCQELAEKFEVSVRTIQRDIEYISMSGVPITSIRGSQGGYRILDSYGVNKQTSNGNDLSSIQLALESLVSSIRDRNIENTLEKIKSINHYEVNQEIEVDFDIVGENDEIQYHIDIIRQAIKNNVSIHFTYINSLGEKSVKQVEPLSLNFKWYTWYLVGYELGKQAYLIFKLSRISDLKNSQQKIGYHDKSIYNFDSLMKRDNRKSTDIQFECNIQLLPYLKEYLPKHRIIGKRSHVVLVEISVFEEEFYWFSILLGLGKGVKIIKPPQIADKIKNHVQMINERYECNQ